MDAAQGKLDNWVNTANKADDFAELSNPAKTIAAKGPQPFKEEYHNYADCYFSLDLLIRYIDKTVVDKSRSDTVEVIRRSVSSIPSQSVSAICGRRFQVVPSEWIKKPPALPAVFLLFANLNCLSVYQIFHHGFSTLGPPLG